MALTDENGGGGIPATMLVGSTNTPYPMYGGNSGFGTDGGWWIVLLIIIIAALGGNWGGNNGAFNGAPIFVDGGNGGSVQRGFDQAAVMSGLNGIQSGLYDLSTQINNQGFAMQSQFANCCCENRLGIADLKYTVATENCADRQAFNEGIRDILANQTASTQRILDQMCQDKIDAKNDEISNLRQQIAMKDLAASQVAQNAFIQQGLTNEVDALYNRLSACPVPTVPVYGRQPIYSCNNGGGCGCGCGNF